MSAARKLRPVPIEDYLSGELRSSVRHEYLNGTVYAMAGARLAHNQIASNALIALGSQLRGKPCRAYNPDTKIRVRSGHETRFYYPDLSVVCHSNPPDALFQDEPVVLMEVISRSTRRVDELEKKDAYLGLPSLRIYLLAEQETATVAAYRRTEDGTFTREVFAGIGAEIPLPEIGATLPLADLYEGVEFVPETEG